MTPKKSIKDILLNSGRIDAEQAEIISAYAKENETSFIKAAQETKIITDKRIITQTLAESLELRFISLREMNIEQTVAHLITGEKARQYNVIPIERHSNGTLVFAVPLKDGLNLQLKDDLKIIAHTNNVEFVVAPTSEIEITIEELFRSDAELKKLSQKVEKDKRAAAVQAAATVLPDEITETSDIAKFVELVLTQAVKDKASDIHFDPQEDQIVVRYRVDGILYNTATAPASSIKEIVSRIKVMAELDIANTRHPQDGRLSLNIASKKIDFRIATLPAVYGEKIVMRILDNSSSSLPLSALGFSAKNFKRLITAANKPYGAVLVTGPTGSGKSTTLYSVLNSLNSPGVNIITAEDPVEYRLKGVNQIQINKKQGLTFEAVLRTVLRADPDIILVGEIRDAETAEIALHAAMTGHMVFSTLHTNDAASALSRLEEMGVEGFMIASTLEAVVSQRLIRRLCDNCKETYTPEVLDLKLNGYPYRDGEPIPTLYKAHENGCKLCKNKGYRGRSGIHEVLVVTDRMRAAIIKGESSEVLNKLALADGMTSMKNDGFEKVLSGFTSLEEIKRVVS